MFKVCAVSETWTDGPGTEEQVLLEVKIDQQVRQSSLIVLWIVWSIMVVVLITLRCVSPDNWKANGLHWLYLGWFFILSKLFDLTQIEHETFAFPFSQLDFKSWQVWGETDRIQKLPVWGFTSGVSPIPSLEKDEHLGWNLSLRQSSTTPIW